MGTEPTRLGVTLRMDIAPTSAEVVQRSWTMRLLEMPPLSIASIKSAVNVAMDVDLDSGIQYEQRCSAMLALTDDRREGHTAFAEKRPPAFVGR